jgi:hypothetical protein
MKTKQVTLAITTVLIVLCFAISPALALTEITWHKFNSETKTFYYCPKTYDVSKASWKVTIFNQLVYNSTTSGAKAVISFAPDTTETTNTLDFVFFGTGEVDINWKGSKVYGGTWTEGAKWYITISEVDDVNTRIYIKEGKTLKWDGEVSGQFKVAVFGASGIANSVTDGKVDVDFGDAGVTVDISSISSMISAFIPVIVLFMLLGMILGMLKKVGKI